MDLLMKAVELVENTKQFAKNRRVDNVYCFFDFIPDEILSMILHEANNIFMSTISKRFNNVYLSNRISIIYEIHREFVDNNPNWLDDIMKYKDMIEITERALILGLSFTNNILSYIDGRYKIKYKSMADCNYNIYYELYSTNKGLSEIIIKKTQNEYVEDNTFYRNEVVVNNKSFLSVGATIAGKSYFICTKSNTPFFSIIGKHVLISDGTKCIIVKTKSLSNHTFNNLIYPLPRSDHPKYKEIMEILNGDNSPIAIETFDYMPY